MPPAVEVADIFCRHGEAYRRDHAGHLGRVERRVMAAIEACRTARLGGHAERCADCGLIRIAYNSCRNRHCPKCQGAARAEWLAARQAELLPVPYFHLVFTLPPAAAEIAFHNKAAVYAILFKAAADTLRTIAADPKHLGAQVGAVAVLHSWGQTLHYHPHVHCIVPGRGPSPGPTRRRAWRRHGNAKMMLLAADEFIRRFLLHSLPDGFHRIRHYGFLANRQRTDNLALCRRLLADAAPGSGCGPDPSPHPTIPTAFEPCPCCGGAMVRLGIVRRPASCRPWRDHS